MNFDEKLIFLYDTTQTHIAKTFLRNFKKSAVFPYICMQDYPYWVKPVEHLQVVSLKNRSVGTCAHLGMSSHCIGIRQFNKGGMENAKVQSEKTSKTNMAT